MAGEISVDDAQKICSLHNHVVHGDPFSSYSNLVSLPDGTFGYAVGKMLDNPALCDQVGMESQCYLIVLSARISSVFQKVALGHVPERE